MLGRIGSTEIVVVLAVLLLLFGGKKLPELAKGMGEALRDFKKALGGEEKKESKEK
jgi:sec-independent protein translocase protein TatA